MTILSRNDQKGRSMVEMLGVLAIIGVLSVGGISGYSKAMAKFKLTKAQDQITMLLMNIRTAFATNPSYDGLTTANSRTFNIAPSDMFSTVTGALNNAFGGRAYVFNCGITEGDNACTTVDNTTGTVQYFGITLDHLGREACVSLASADWGTDGLMGIYVTGGTAKAFPTKDIPLSFAEAGTACPGSGGYGSITWVYY